MRNEGRWLWRLVENLRRGQRRGFWDLEVREAAWIRPREADSISFIPLCVCVCVSWVVSPRNTLALSRPETAGPGTDNTSENISFDI